MLMRACFTSGLTSIADRIPASTSIAIFSSEGLSVGTIGRFQVERSVTFRSRFRRSWASPICPSARMISCSRWAIVTSVWTISIGASAPTSILIFVIRLKSFARSRASFLDSRFALA